MKKIILAAILTTSLMATACSIKDTTAVNTKTSSVLSDTETDDTEQDSHKNNTVKTAKAEAEKIINQNTSETQSSAEQSQKEVSETEEQNEPLSESIAETESSEAEDIEAIGNALFKKSCQVTWDMLIGCPYNLNYETMTSGGAVLIDDPDVTCLEDIINDYCLVFDTPNSNLYEKYFESENGVYCFDGGRGADRSYTDTDLILISQSETEAVFNAVSYHKDPDTQECGKDEINEFVIVKSDGVWKTKTFTLPY